ncbi:MAG: hypothetical protein HY647_06210 [Acidobacteria bacterium]|nr:hypothetical protein [Acidobacteriota bacterium]
MTTPATELNDVLKRLEKLERQNRRLKQIGAVALVVIAALVLMGQAFPTRTVAAQSSPQRTVEANEFILRDGDGKVRAMLTSSGLNLIDVDGNLRAAVGVTPVGPVLMLQAADQKTRAVLALELGVPILRLYTDDKGGALIAMRPNGPNFTLFDANEQGRVVAALGQDGATLSLHNADGKTRVGLADRTDASALILYSPNGEERVKLIGEPDGAELLLGVLERSSGRLSIPADTPLTGPNVLETLKPSGGPVAYLYAGDAGVSFFMVEKGVSAFSWLMPKLLMLGNERSGVTLGTRPGPLSPGPVISLDKDKNVIWSAP